MTSSVSNIADPELAKIQSAIAAAWSESSTPPELRAACESFARGDGRRHLEELRAIIIVSIGVWIRGGIDAGFQRAVLEQTAWAEMHHALAMMVRAAKERDGEAFVAARLAIVAFFMADVVGKADPFKCDVDGAVDAWLSPQPEETAE